VLTFDTSVLVDEKEHRGMNAIRLQQIGSKKEHCIRFDVGLSLSLSINRSIDRSTCIHKPTHTIS
jgi:hypothetical protein